MKNHRKKKKDEKRQRKPAKATFKLCPETREKIWFKTVTLADIRHAEKTGDTLNGRMKQLVRIPSKITREKCYENAARALEWKESKILPMYGGRPWKVFCRINEPQNSQKPPLFRWFRGELELAVLPHLLAKVPKESIIKQKGKATKKGEIEEDEENSVVELSERAESQLSRMAWSDGEHQIPTFTIKWLSPNHQYFYSRKAVGEHAQILHEQQLLVDKIVFGVGIRGQALRPSKPTKADSLKAGKFRFLRDGLWIVGQEESWQIKRAEEVDAKRKETEKLAEKRETVVRTPSKPKSPFQLFLRSQRVHYRISRLKEINSISEDKINFVLGDADRELREIWKNMSKDEKQIWKDRLEGKVISEKERNFWQDQIDGKDVLNLNNSIEPNFQQDGVISISSTKHQIQNKSKEKIWGGIEIYMRDMYSQQRSELGNVKEDSTRDLLLKRWECLDQKSKQEWEQKALLESGTETTKHVVISPVDSDDSDEAKSDINKKRSSKSQIADEPRRSKRARRIKRPFDEEMQSLEEKIKKRTRRPSKWILPVGNDSTDIIIDAAISVTNSTSKENKTKQKNTSSLLKKMQCLQSLHWRLSPTQIQLCYDAAIEHFEKVMVTVKARGLHAELIDGFDLLRERGRGRYDMELPAFDEPKFSFLTDLEKAPWMEVVREALGQDVALIHKGVFLSNPGASSQNYHQDGPHLTTAYQRPCHAINVFIPLVDLTRRNGPTEFVLGSHILGFDGYDREKVVLPQVSAGTPIIFDYRLGHRGLSNSSDACRPIVYCTYAAATNGKEFRDIANFSRRRYHRLGELLDKPLSREERLKLRRKTQSDQNSAEIESNQNSAEMEEKR